MVRHERLTLGIARPHLAEVQLKDRDRKEYLQPDKLVPVTGLPAELAAKVTEGETTPLDKARAIYDYVFTTMRYDKTGTGWGHGDVLYACDAKKGNCTDFHSLFIAMARSQGIPARFEIGFPLPPDKHSGEIAGYHCWADFFEPQHGWVPVDISEAWKHQEKRDYFFGAHDANRVQFSMGRDLRLNPKQDGAPLNYFVYPYVEVAGKEYPNVSMAFSFADVDAGKRRRSSSAVGTGRLPERSLSWTADPSPHEHLSPVRGRFCRNTACLGAGIGVPLAVAPQNEIQHAVFTASGREKSILADSAAPCPLAGFV